MTQPIPRIRGVSPYGTCDVAKMLVNPVLVTFITLPGRGAKGKYCGEIASWSVCLSALVGLSLETYVLISDFLSKLPVAIA